MKRLTAIVLSLVMMITMATPVMAATDAKASHGVNYLALGDSVAAGCGTDNYNYKGYYPHDTKFENSKNGSYTKKLNDYFTNLCGVQGAYSYDATASSFRMKDLAIGLGLTEKNDDYNGGEKMAAIFGNQDTDMGASYDDSMAAFKRDKAKIDEAIINADVITLNYGANELFTSFMDAVGVDMLQLLMGGDSSDVTVRKAVDALKLALKALTTEQKNVREFASSWNKVLTYIREKNPDATIVFVGAYNAITLGLDANNMGDLNKIATPIYDEIVNSVNNYVRYGKTGSRTFTVSERNRYSTLNDKKILYVDTAYIVKNKAVNNIDTIHPNEEGHTYILNSVLSELKSNANNCKHTATAVVNTKKATPFVKGYTGDTVCAVCGKLIESGKATPTVKSSVKYATVPCKVKQSFKVTSNMNIAKGDSVSKVTTSSSKIAKAKGTKVTAGKKKGTATVTVTMKSGQKYTFKVKVQKSAVKCSKLSTKVASKVTIKKGKKLSIGASKAPFTCKYKITYKSSKKSVATVSKKGTITAKKRGTAKIKVYCKGKKKTITVTVK